MNENSEAPAEELHLDENIEKDNDVSENENLEETPSVEEQLTEEKNRYVRLYAEFENYKKRTTKEKMEFYSYANQDIMISMLGVLDDFERALKEISKTENADGLVKGVELIYQKLKSKLSEKGLSPIEVQIGDSFDVDKHEAITQIPAPSEELKTKIVDVIETGYMLYDKVIRFARVVVGA